MKSVLLYLCLIGVFLVYSNASIQSINNRERQALTQQIMSHVKSQISNAFSNKQVLPSFGYNQNYFNTPTINSQTQNVLNQGAYNIYNQYPSQLVSNNNNQITYLASTPAVTSQNINYANSNVLYPSIGSTNSFALQNTQYPAINTNYINGLNNNVNGQQNIITGNSNSLSGSQNIALGSSNSILGNVNRVNANQAVVKGNKNVVYDMPINVSELY